MLDSYDIFVSSSYVSNTYEFTCVTGIFVNAYRLYFVIINIMAGNITLKPAPSKAEVTYRRGRNRSFTHDSRNASSRPRKRSRRDSGLRRDSRKIKNRERHAPIDKNEVCESMISSRKDVKREKKSR